MRVDPDDLRAFAERYTSAWCSQDPTRVSSCYAPGGSLTINNASPSIGRPAIAEAARSFMAAFPDMQVLFDNLVIDGDRVEYHWTLMGTHTGPGGTGRPVRISGYEQWQLGPDGFIVSSLGHFDEVDYQRQLNG